MTHPKRATFSNKMAADLYTLTETAVNKGKNSSTNNKGPVYSRNIRIKSVNYIPIMKNDLPKQRAEQL